MKKIFSIFAMAAVVLASCVKEQAPVLDGDQNEATPSENLVEKVFTVSDGESKTYIDGTVANNKVVIKWCADDAISVWDGVANRKFTMVGEPEGASATFKGLVSESATDFYAIYPYDEALICSESNGTMTFSVSKPAVQYANPEGGLADGSAYACGKADENGNITFVNRSTLLKFSLASGMNVKSLTIKGNEDDDTMAGTLSFIYNDSKNFSLGWKSAGKSTELTFCNEDGSNLKTGVDYYISLIGNTFGKGYAVTLTFGDGTTITRDSDKSIQYMSNQIYSLASKPLSRITFGATYYEAYEAGEDIMIAGKAYNKTTHPGAVLLTETSTISEKGLYFLAPGEGQTITLGTTRVDEMILVGNDPSSRAKVIPNEGIRLNKNGRAAVFNVEFSSITVSAKQLIDENVCAESVVLDNCKIYTPNASSTSILYSQIKEGGTNITATTTAIGEFKMCNSDYVVTRVAAANNDGAILLNCGLQGTNITLDNNLFYVEEEDDTVVLKFKLTSVASNEVGNLIMKNNTFIHTCQNAGTSGFFTNGVVFESIDVQNNLFYVPLMENNNHYIFMVGLNFGGGTTANNYYYKGDNAKNFRMFNGSQNTPSFASTDLTKLTADPFSSRDHANGVFVKTAAAASYGAKR